MQPALTQVIELTRKSPTHLALSLKEIAPEKVRTLVLEIIKNDLFNPEQKTFAMHWESHCIHLLTHPNRLLPAKAACFLGMKVITPTLVLYRDNRLASDQLIPVVSAHRELIALLLPANVNIDEFILQCEEVYDLKIETTMKLNDILAMNREIEQMLNQTANASGDKITSNSNCSRELLRELAQKWRSRIIPIHAKLSQLNEEADSLNKKFQQHSHNLERDGTQLAEEQQIFLKLVEELKTHLGKI
jgi:hypothetical protein